MQIQLFEQQSQQLNQQLQLIEQNINELEEINLSLREIEKADSREILANIGKRIYLPVDIKDKNLIVEIGNKNFVKKTIPETREVIKDQIKKLGINKEKIVDELEILQDQANEMMLELETEMKREKGDEHDRHEHNHDHSGHNHEHGHDHDHAGHGHKH